MKYIHIKLIFFLYGCYIAFGNEVEPNEPHHHKYSASEGEFWIYLLYALGLSLLAAFCSGNT